MKGFSLKEISAKTKRLLCSLWVLIALWIFSFQSTAYATHTSFVLGDLFISLSTGEVQWRHSDTSLNAILVTAAGGQAKGMGFNAAQNLFVTHWLPGNTTERFDTSGTLLGTFGSGYADNPSSIVFDAAGNAYVGQADTTGDILKFDAAGNLVASFNALTEARGTSWIDLAPDQCTIFYTSEWLNVLRYNVCTNTQSLLPFNVAPLPGGVEGAHALRILPDDGGVLVANFSVVVRLDAAGNQIKTYDVLGGNCFTGLDLDVDLASFWTTDFCNKFAYKFDLATGTLLDAFLTTDNALVHPKGVAVARGVVRPPVPGEILGRMTGGGSIFRDGKKSRVTHGFELHCNASTLPNNLQINWNQGDKFHLEQLISAVCTDDPTIRPDPPPAPFDTYEGKGTGRYNGQSGYCAEWIFTDAGEPGKHDRIRRLIITNCTTGAVVLSVEEPGRTLTFGNHQAHR